MKLPFPEKARDYILEPLLRSRRSACRLLHREDFAGPGRRRVRGADRPDAGVRLCRAEVGQAPRWPGFVLARLAAGEAKS
jgi:hypothetical protein